MLENNGLVYARYMLIRQARQDDGPAIAQGEADVTATPGLLNTAPNEIPLTAYQDKIAILTDHPRGLYILAEEGGHVAAHLLLDPLPLQANNHIVTLTIVVYPKWQERGVGRALMEHAITWAVRTPGIEKIELMVRAANERAINLYRSLGFEEEGRIKNRVKLANGYLDDIAMGLFVLQNQT